MSSRDQNLSHIVPLDFNSLDTLPESHTWTSNSSSTDHDSFADSVPIIDLMDPNAAYFVRHACEHWGMFQVTNHGVPMDLISEAKSQTYLLFDLPRDQKLRALRASEGLTGYGEARISSHLSSRLWSEGFTIMGSPVEHATQLWPDDHSVHTYFCNVMEGYKEEMKKLSTKMIRLMLGSLGLDVYEDVTWMKPKNRRRNPPHAVLQLNSYPVCPDPGRAMGLAPHTDSSVLTLLNQSNISGLQVLQDGIDWVPVHPIPGALVVNVGDLMHVLSNGQFKSAMHRAVVNNAYHRISIAYLYGPPWDVKISPSMKLVDQDHPRLYPRLTWKEYLEIKATYFNAALEFIRN